MCDDIADEDLPAAEKDRLFAQTRKRLAECLEGRPEGPLYVALADTARTFDIPGRYFEEVIEGVEMDLVTTRYQTFTELSSYCYKVASVVGLICIEIFGYEDPRAKEYAVDLGHAMQITNILRDVKEDAGRGRIYIPMDEMASFGYTERQLMDGVNNDAFRAVMAFQAARARRYFESGRRLFPLLSPESRGCPAVLYGVYSTILDRIEASGFDVFDRRIGLSGPEKLLITARLWTALLRPKIPLLRR